MGMGYSASYAETIKEELINKVASKEFKAFITAIDDNEDFSLEDVARDAQYDDFENYGENSKIEKAYRTLQKKFKKETGLTLWIGYHDSEEGDRYDDVDGVFWSVGGVYQKTPAGKKYSKYISRAYFVTFG